ncbi:procathepsin L-like [Heptranchias perlo]|uniref:procathepsin L-like n=1 Tax=Heptranchias perlo TaxID=212740 RepID=UPI00355A8CB9
MNFSLFVGCVVVSVLVVASGSTFDSTLDDDWKNWKSEHEKQYTEDEDTHRRIIWEDNMRYIKQHNLEHSMGKHTFTVGMNQFGDLTTEEFNEHMNGFLQVRADNSTEEEVDKDDDYDEDNVVDEDDVVDADDESNDGVQGVIVDWRTKGYVTPVKNQGRCDSSWAFSATGALEGQMFRRTRKLVSLSEQNLVDCSRRYGTYGCRGGWMHLAYRYVMRNRGINSAATYPYTGRDGLCRFKRNSVAATCKSYRFVRRNCEPCLARAVKYRGPIAVAIDAGHRSFQLYRNGIYYDQNCNRRRLNHAVLVVGYGRSGRRNYWIVKNSWGRRWGLNGYINMAKDMRNHCGIASYSVFPIV